MKSAKRVHNKLENITDMEVCYTLSQAYEEASRCLLCYDAPCSQDCPAKTDPGTFIRKLRFKNIKGAIRTIKENNSLGGVCGVVCPTDQLCQKACSKTEIDKPIEIGKLQRFLIEQSWKINFDPVEKEEPKNLKVAIIGSGPAGLSCGAQLARQGVNSTIFEAKEKPGGVLRYGVPQFRLNSEFLNKELQDIEKLGVEIKCSSKINNKDIEKLLNDGFNAVFIAPGVWKPYKLNIPGSDLENIITATDFLEQARNGSKDSLIGKINKKNVAVMGGGSVAMDVACTCKGLGANKVYIIYRRSEREMPASKEDLEMARDNYVIVRPLSGVTEFIGENGKLTGLKGIEYDWDKPDLFIPSNLKPVPGTEFSLKVDTFVFAIGSGVDSEVKELCDSIKYKDNGLIITKDDGVSTSNEKVFAGGDIVRGSATVVEAVADGKKAADQIIKRFCNN